MFVLVSFVVVFFIVFAAWKLHGYITDKYTVFDAWPTVMGFIAILITAAGVIFIAIAVCYQMYHDKVGEVVETKEIVALSNASSIEGNFFLGSGQIEGKQYYYYFTKIGRGYKMESVRVEHSILFESVTDPRIEKMIVDPTGGWEYHIFIPENSIAFGFNVSLPQ